MTIYLYVKTHNKTGLKYLGKTVSTNPHEYQGSGIYWTRHIKENGYDVTTEILKECSTEEELKKWGQYYSSLWNIVSSVDENGRKIWANLRPEEGTGGWGGENNPNNLPHVKKAKRERMLGDNNQAKLPEIKNKIAESTRLAMATPEVKERQLNGIRSEKWMNRRKERVGKDAPNYDGTIFCFVHESGLIENCTKHELRLKYGKQIQSHKLAKGQIKVSRGWRIIPHKLSP
jgi:hypothetical protein